jgi:hypothetical protein
MRTRADLMTQEKRFKQEERRGEDSEAGGDVFSINDDHKQVLID